MTAESADPHADRRQQRTPLSMRRARRDDLEIIVRLLADDPLGAKRERYELPLPPEYGAAFSAIDRDPNHELAVACLDDEVVGVMQLTYLPNLTYRGGWRALIEGVRIAARVRSTGIGRDMFTWAIDRARARGCRLVQLTTDKSRPAALRFYQSLGFEASHEGMKLNLGDLHDQTPLPGA
jgi:GNAT superfamily N-acetyltransferase